MQQLQCSGHLEGIHLGRNWSNSELEALNLPTSRACNVRSSPHGGLAGAPPRPYRLPPARLCRGAGGGRKLEAQTQELTGHEIECLRATRARRAGCSLWQGPGERARAANCFHRCPLVLLSIHSDAGRRTIRGRA